MQHTHKKIIWFSGLAILVVIALLLVGGIWLYSGRLTQAKLPMFKSLGLPIAKVGGVFLSAKNYDSETKGTALELSRLRAIAEEKVSVTGQDIEDAAGSMGDGETESALEAFVLENKLAAWYVQHASTLEPPLAQRLAGVQQKLVQGVPLSELAEQFSEDTATKWFTGDTGYINLAEAIPEYRRGVQSLEIDRVGIVYTRYGAHIVQVLERITQEGTEYTRIREIVLLPKGFESWLAKEKQAVPVVWYVK